MMDDTDLKVTVARIDERTANLMVQLEQVLHLKDEVASIRSKVAALEKDVATKVGQTEFKPIRSLAFGMVAACLMAVLGGLLSLVIKQ